MNLDKKLDVLDCTVEALLQDSDITLKKLLASERECCTLREDNEKLFHHMRNFRHDAMPHEPWRSQYYEAIIQVADKGARLLTSQKEIVKLTQEIRRLTDG